MIHFLKDVKLELLMNIKIERADIV